MFHIGKTWFHKKMEKKPNSYESSKVGKNKIVQRI
mgnify:CR=1 FL=1